jgi:hypothetical protein
MDLVRLSEFALLEDQYWAVRGRAEPSVAQITKARLTGLHRRNYGLSTMSGSSSSGFTAA